MNKLAQNRHVFLDHLFRLLGVIVEDVYVSHGIWELRRVQLSYGNDYVCIGHISGDMNKFSCLWHKTT